MDKNIIIPSVHGFANEPTYALVSEFLKYGESSIIHFDGLDDLAGFTGILEHFQATADIHLLSQTPTKDLISIIQMNLQFPVRVCMHIESNENTIYFCELARENRMIPGIAYKLNTNIESDSDIIDRFDYIHLVCNDAASNKPNFDDRVFDKMELVREYWGQSKFVTLDSGVKEIQIKPSVEKGVNNLVMGSAIFKTEDPLATLRRFNQISHEGNLID